MGYSSASGWEALFLKKTEKNGAIDTRTKRNDAKAV